MSAAELNAFEHPERKAPQKLAGQIGVVVTSTTKAFRGKSIFAGVARWRVVKSQVVTPSDSVTPSDPAYFSDLRGSRHTLWRDDFKNSNTRSGRSDCREARFIEASR